MDDQNNAPDGVISAVPRHGAPPTITAEDDIATRLANRDAFVGLGQHDLARGALNLVAVAALRIAATRSSSAFAHEVKVRRLREALNGFDGAERTDLATLMKAALDREAAERVAGGLAPHGRRLRGCLAGVATNGAASHPRLTRTSVAPQNPTRTDAARCAEGYALGDVDVVLAHAISVVREIIRRVRLGANVQAQFDVLERVSLGLCVQRIMSQAERAEARPTLVILAVTLRRRRPLVAAILRRRLVMDRRRS